MRAWFANCPFWRWTRRHLAEIALFLTGMVWAIFLFAPLYPHPLRWISDDLWYLSVSHQIIERGVPYRNVIFDDYDGGELRNMVALGQPEPIHRHVLDYHFPAYSFLLSLFIRFTGNDYAAISLMQSLLLGGIAALTCRLGRRLMPPPAAFLAALAICFSPTLAIFTPAALPELLLVFLAMLSVAVATAATRPGQHLAAGLLLSLLALGRYGFLVLAGVVLIEQMLAAHKHKERPWWRLFCYGLPFLASMTLGANGLLYYRTPAAKCLPSGDVLDIFYNLYNNTYLFFSSALALDGNSLHSRNEIYIFAGLLTLFLGARWFRHDPFYRIVFFSHLGILGGLMLFCSWMWWQHIRVTMWFLPFAYLLAFAMFSRIPRVTPRRMALVLFAALVAWAAITHDRGTLAQIREEAAEIRPAFAKSAAFAAYLDAHQPDAVFVAVTDHQLLAAALRDGNRTYASPTPPLVPYLYAQFMDTGILPDVLVLDEKEEALLLSGPLHDHYATPPASFHDGISTFRVYARH